MGNKRSFFSLTKLFFCAIFKSYLKKTKFGWRRITNIKNRSNLSLSEDSRCFGVNFLNKNKRIGPNTKNNI